MFLGVWPPEPRALPSGDEHRAQPALSQRFVAVRDGFGGGRARSALPPAITRAAMRPAGPTARVGGLLFRPGKRASSGKSTARIRSASRSALGGVKLIQKLVDAAERGSSVSAVDSLCALLCLAAASYQSRPFTQA